MEKRGFEFWDGTVRGGLARVIGWSEVCRVNNSVCSVDLLWGRVLWREGEGRGKERGKENVFWDGNGGLFCTRIEVRMLESSAGKLCI